MSEEQDWVSEAQFAVIINRSQRAIYNWRQKGISPAWYRGPGNQVRFKLIDVLAFKETLGHRHFSKVPGEHE